MPVKIKSSNIRAMRIMPRKGERVISATNVNGRGAVVTFQKIRRMIKAPKFRKRKRT